MESKSIFLSVTFWGVIVGLVSTALKKYGYTLDEAGLTNDAVTLASAAVAIYGRMRASQQLHVIAPATTDKQGGFIRLALLPLLFLMALYGCAVMEGLTSPLHKQPTAEQEAAETPAQKALRLAHATIDEANAALLSLDKVINDNFDNQVWTKAEAQGYLDQSVKFGKQLDKAREALRLGDLTGAQQQAEALRNLIITLQRKAAAGAR